MARLVRPPKRAKAHATPAWASIGTPLWLFDQPVSVAVLEQGG